MAQSEPPRFDLRLVQTQEYHIYTPYMPLRIEVEISSSSERTTDAQLELRLFDLITRRMEHLRPVEMRLSPGINTLPDPLVPTDQNGVFKLEAVLMVGGEPAAKTEATFGISPAPQAKNLPDEWPLGFHLSGRTEDAMVLPGAKWVRNFAHWYLINPEPGVFEWGEGEPGNPVGMDRAMSAAERDGAKVLWVLMRTPAFAVQPPQIRKFDTSDRNRLPMAPTDYEALRMLLDQVLERYGERLSAIEIWNEPNVQAWWQDSPENYVRLARAVREWRDQRAPWIRLVGISMSSGIHAQWVRSTVEAGLLQEVDIVSLHPYDELFSPYGGDHGRPSLFDQIDTMRRFAPIQDSRGKSGPPIWLTEAGLPMAFRQDGVPPTMTELNRHLREAGLWHAQDPTRIRKEAEQTPAPGLITPEEQVVEPELQRRAVSEERAAALVVRAVALMYHRPGVEKIFFYALGGRPFGPDDPRREQRPNYHRSWFVPDYQSPMLPVISYGVLARNLVDVDWRAPVETSVLRQKERDIFLTRFKTDQGFFSIVFSQIPEEDGEPLRHPMLWQDNYSPVEVLVPVKGDLVVISDLWGGDRHEVPVQGGSVEIPLTEVPLYLHEHVSAEQRRSR